MIDKHKNTRKKEKGEREREIIKIFGQLDCFQNFPDT